MLNFVVLGSPRTGSNLLSAAIRAHPDAVMFGELLNRNSQVAIDELRSKWPDCPYQHQWSTAELLAEWVFNPWRHDPETRAVGFKLFYGQGREDDAAFSCWRRLLDDRDVRIVHIVRENLLDAMVSFRMALATDTWAVKQNLDGTYTTFGDQGQARNLDSTESHPIRILPTDAHWFFTTVIAERNWAVRAFHNHASFVVDYESLSLDFQGTLTDVFRFLQLPYLHVHPAFIKQSRGTPKDLVENYAELKDYFCRSVFSEYFAW